MGTLAELRVGLNQALSGVDLEEGLKDMGVGEREAKAMARSKGLRAGQIGSSSSPHHTCPTQEANPGPHPHMPNQSHTYPQ